MNDVGPRIRFHDVSVSGDGVDRDTVLAAIEETVGRAAHAGQLGAGEAALSSRIADAIVTRR